MKSHFLAIHPLIGTKHKPSPLHLQQRSVYYWWWAYLRRNSEYLECCERGGIGRLASLYADFGDVRTDDFRSWWGGSRQRGVFLFAEQNLELTVNKIDAVQDWNQQWGDEVLVVAVNLALGRRKIQSMFAKVLQKEHEGKRGRKAMGKAQSTARYPIYRNFSVYNLKRMLMVYEAFIENESKPKSEKIPLWRIGEQLKLVPSAMPKKTDNAYDTRNNHNIMTMTVSRYVKTAKMIIEGVANGKFPMSDA